MLVDLVFLLTESADQKRQKNRGENWRNYYDVLVPGMRITSRTLWTTTNIRKAGPAAKGRDNEGQMRRSHVCFSGLVATSDVPGTCPTQKLPLFFNVVQMGPRKKQMSYFGDPQTGESMPPRVSYICKKFHRTRVVCCSF